jgi:hypothetical protein
LTPAPPRSFVVVLVVAPVPVLHPLQPALLRFLDLLRDRELVFVAVLYYGRPRVPPMALAQPNQMIPFSTATTTAKDRPIIDWLPLARMATIIVIVTTARAAGKAATLPALRLICQQAMADRVRLTAKLTAAPFRRFVIAVMATAWSAGIGARAIHMVAAVARAKARTATAADVRDSRETGTPTCLVMGRAAAAENATAPAMDNQNSSKSTGLVIRYGAVCS